MTVTIHVSTITHPAPLMHQNKITLIDQMDLEPIKFKLIKEEGWNLARCERVELCYKGFLKLILLCPDEISVPSIDIDEMWHTHILDTRKYMTDCHAIFGEYIHHYPYLGLKDEADAAELEKRFAETRQRYEALLGFDIFADSLMADCGGGCGGSCGSSCGGGSSCSSSSSCGTSSSCGSDKGASCGTYLPTFCSSDGGKDKDKDKDKSSGNKRNSWWPKLRLDGASPEMAKWLESVAPQDLSRQYRPGRADISAL